MNLMAGKKENMQEKEHVVYEKSPDGHVTIFLNRPDICNALNEDLIEDLTYAFERAIDDADVQAIVMAGRGRMFCAGADLNWMKRVAAYAQSDNIKDAWRLAHLMETIALCPKPTVALIHKGAFGGGVGLAAACDIAIADEAAIFCLSEVRLGLIPAVISPYLCQAMSPRRVAALTLTGERFSAASAQVYGLIHHIAPTEKLQVACDQVLASLRQGSPFAQALTKQLLGDVAGRDIDEGLQQLTAEYIAHARASEDGREGVRAFLEKRQPVWHKELR